MQVLVDRSRDTYNLLIDLSPAGEVCCFTSGLSLFPGSRVLEGTAV
jgi:hypothetical protein